ncbi:MAG TPA: penicillin acylase family protein [Solirubrobacteraceae bacterium]|nr:penicillin acylase family protein [Solirubrobacteraceae bacterium]
MKTAATVAALVAAAFMLGAPIANADVTPQPYGTNDYGGFRDILPPGTNGFDNAVQLAQFEATGQRPAHASDQLAMYDDLLWATPGLQPQDVGKYFKDATFGVRPEDVASTESPRSDVTIVRDKQFGVPHVYGSTRAGLMFGAGYAAAEDRLFFMDVLRHLGRGELAAFAGGAPANRELDAEQWAVAPYTEADLQAQADSFVKYGAEGQGIHDDVSNYVAGINAYIAQARLNPLLMPGEYAAIGKPQGPDDWNITDVVATASLIGGIFGKGGGRELAQAQLLQSFQARYGKKLGHRLWLQFAAFDDPDAPTTVKHGRFPYQVRPKRFAHGAEVLPDPGSLKNESPVAGGAGASVGHSATEVPDVAAAQGLLAFPQAMSNALVIGAQDSADGHPLAVFGPQVGYFAPQILMEEDLHGPQMDAAGAAFPGVNMYVELGHGRDYAWSATSAGEDIIDTFALPLCDPDHYRFRGQCLPIEVLTRTESWTPNAADQTPAGTATFRAERTKLGLVVARGTYKGRPVLFTQLRSTYMHEVDSAAGFRDFDNPDVITGPQAFQQAAYKIGYTFNWFYVDDRDTAYFNSGNNPVRQPGTTGQLPMASTKEWVGWNPDDDTAQYTPFSQHPQVIDQDWMTSWNNRQAAGYAGADSNLYSSVYRSQMLDHQIRMRLAGGRKMTLPGLIDAMEEAGKTDLRGLEDLPLALRVLGKVRNPALQRAIDTLRAWQKAGAQRFDSNRDGTYDYHDAVRLMDAWWPLLTQAVFQPAMGKPLYDTLKSTYGLDNDPNNAGGHLGSAYQDGFYGYVKKDLRDVLRLKVKQRYARTFCGSGSLRRCRAALAGSLLAAARYTDKDLYSGDPICQAAKMDGSQWCWDAIRMRPLGAITQPLIEWVNRPTFQQAVEVQGHRPR